MISVLRLERKLRTLEGAIHAPYYITDVDQTKCFLYFTTHYGCSICIKECTFFRKPFDEIKTQFRQGITYKNMLDSLRKNGGLGWMQNRY